MIESEETKNERTEKEDVADYITTLQHRSKENLNHLAITDHPLVGAVALVHVNQHAFICQAWGIPAALAAVSAKGRVKEWSTKGSEGMRPRPLKQHTDRASIVLGRKPAHRSRAWAQLQPHTYTNTHAGAETLPHPRYTAYAAAGVQTKGVIQGGPFQNKPKI